MDVFIVELSKRAQKDLQKVPVYIAMKLQMWVEFFEEQGVRAVRKIPSFHDEPLQGNRKGQRSIRLNKAYRAIYIEKINQRISLLEVQEVNKHDY